MIQTKELIRCEQCQELVRQRLQGQTSAAPPAESTAGGVGDANPGGASRYTAHDYEAQPDGRIAAAV